MSQQRVMAPGQALVVAPSGGLVKGQGYLSGTVFGVIGDDIAEGDEGYMDTEGAYPLPFGGGAAGNLNALAFWDADGNVYPSYSAGRTQIGTFAVVAGVSDATCFVMLGGKNAATGQSGNITAAVDVTYTNGGLPEVADVGGALDKIVTRFAEITPDEVDVTVLNTAATGSSAADPDLIGGTVAGFCPGVGCESPVLSIVVGVDGAVTVTLAEAQAIGNAVVNVQVRKAS